MGEGGSLLPLGLKDLTIANTPTFILFIFQNSICNFVKNMYRGADGLVVKTTDLSVSGPRFDPKQKPFVRLL